MAEEAEAPAIRFKGFTDDWNSVNRRRRNRIQEERRLLAKGILQWSDSGIRSAEINSNTTELFLSECGLTNSSAKMVYAGDILYTVGATSGGRNSPNTRRN